MRIATWNVNSVAARLPRLLDWLGTAEPDVLCLQEIKVAADDFPVDEVGELGYEVAAHGTGRWAGVAILSRVGLSGVRRGLLDEPGFQAEDAMFEVHEPRAIGATCGGIRAWSVYVPNGREVGHPHYDYKLRWLHALRATVDEESVEDQPLPCWATSTSRRPTPTSGTSPDSPPARTSPSPNARRCAPCATPAWPTSTLAR